MNAAQVAELARLGVDIAEAQTVIRAVLSILSFGLDDGEADKLVDVALCSERCLLSVADLLEKTEGDITRLRRR